jgi:hypothetical protein
MMFASGQIGIRGAAKTQRRLIVEVGRLAKEH